MQRAAIHAARGPGSEAGRSRALTSTRALLTGFTRIEPSTRPLVLGDELELPPLALGCAAPAPEGRAASSAAGATRLRRNTRAAHPFRPYVCSCKHRQALCHGTVDIKGLQDLGVGTVSSHARWRPSTQEDGLRAPFCSGHAPRSAPEGQPSDLSYWSWCCLRVAPSEQRWPRTAVAR
jgi:hypothetical protein